MNDHLHAKVLSWIGKGGIPVEYAASRAARRAGLEVEQGVSYIENGVIAREVDVLATVRGSRATVRLVLECKASRGKPWVVMTNRRSLEPPELLGAAIASEPDRHELIAAFWRAKQWGDPSLPAFLAPSSDPGFSAVVAADLSAENPADRDDRNLAWRAIAQVVSAAIGVYENGRRSALVWPAVVLDGPLYELRYTDDGVEELRSVARSRLMSWTAAPVGRAVAVDIVTLANIDPFVAEASEGLRAISQRLDGIRRARDLPAGTENVP